MTKAELGITKLVNRFAETGDPKLFIVLTRHLEDGSSGSNSAGAVAAALAPLDDDRANAILEWFLKENQGGSTDGAGS